MIIRKVIGRGVLSRDCIVNQRIINNWEGVDDEHTPRVEVTALVELERKLLRGERAKWKENQAHKQELRHDLIIKDGVIASVWYSRRETTTWRWCWEISEDIRVGCEYYEACEVTQQAAEEALADNKLFGFGWEEEFALYRVFYLTKGGSVSSYPYTQREIAVKNFRRFQNEGTKTRMYGITKALDLVEIVLDEESEISNKGLGGKVS